MITGATLWAILYGHRKFVVVIAATKADSVKIASNVKVTIESDELIQADFPEAAYPIQKLEGVNNRANAQTLNGELTRIRWTREEIVFPNIPSAPSSCARLYCRSITGAIRGLSDKLPDGSTIRPELVLLDDPQTERFVLFYKPSLQRLGMNVNVRVVDAAQYENRLRQWDFDIIIASWGQSLSPGNEQRGFWSTQAADQPGSRKLAVDLETSVEAARGER